MEPANLSNPFNIRGVAISPVSPNRGTSQQDIHYFLYFMDTVLDSFVDQCLFGLSNPNEIGNMLNYYYRGSLVVPTKADYDSGNIQSIALPLYTNQKIDRPNQEQNNLVPILTVEGNNKAMYKGNPQLRIPPVSDDIFNAEPLISFPIAFNSLTDKSCNCLVVLANTGPSRAISSGVVTPERNEAGYALTFTFDEPGPDGRPDVDYSRVCAGMIGQRDLSVFESVVAQDRSGQYVGAPIRLDFNNGSIPYSAL